MEELDTSTTTRQAGCSILLKSCLVITALLIVLFMAGLIYMLRMSSVRSLAACAENMRELSAAIRRYDDVNGRRPSELAVLREEYLQDASVLRCPLDKSPGSKPSYEYNPRARGTQVMLRCDRHRIRKDMPVSKLVVYGDGRFEVVRPSFQETLDAAEKHARKRKTHGDQ